MAADYQRDIIRQLEESILIAEKLTAENAALRKELKEQSERFTGILEQLTEKINAQATENEKLKAIINKNSGNSSKPPSSDGYKKIHNSREQTGRKPGGQKGHKGNKPALLEQPTVIIEHKPECACGGHVRYSNHYIAKQHIDIEIRAHIIEHRAFSGVCDCCGSKVSAKMPLKDVITYGEHVKGLAVMLSTEGLVSLNRVRTMLSELTSGRIVPSEGTLVKWTRDLSSKLDVFYEKLKGKLLAQPVLHKDETGHEVNGKLQWLHVLSDRLRTLYFSHGKRGNDADKEIGILPIFSGVLVHDHLKGLYQFTCDHAECNAHILRYLKAASQEKGRQWAVAMIELLVEINHAVKAARSEGKSAFDSSILDAYAERYDKVLESGFAEFLLDENPDYNGDDMKLLRRLREYRTEHLRFAYDFRVPFDNNQAERDLRMIKGKQKISGCFRSDAGSHAFAIIKSYSSTLRKNDCDTFAAFLAAFSGRPLLIGVE